MRLTKSSFAAVPRQHILVVTSPSAYTLVFGQILQVDQNGEVVARLGLYNIGTVFALEYCLCAVLDQFLEALDVQRDDNLGLALRGRDVEGDAIEVGHNLVNVGGSSSAALLATWQRRGGQRGRACAPGEAVLEDGLNEDILVVEEKHRGGAAPERGVMGVCAAASCQRAVVAAAGGVPVPCLAGLAQ